ncbi:MAG TPA: hypothetical protein VKZ67_08895 [Natronosporangium sp.]|nr:hypothetical protein [Natronosporangium sp.]
MITARTSVPRFTLDWPRWQPPATTGLAAFVSSTASVRWADGLLAREDGRLVVFAATGREAEPQALARLRYPGVQAVTLVPCRSDPRWVRLALEVALSLANCRSSELGRYEACLTSYQRPSCPPGAVRIPHLVTVGRGTSVTDTVIWELTPVPVAQQWLGGPLPDLCFFEQHLEALVRLRGALRRGWVPVRAAAARLPELLGNQELSIRLVYQHASRFRTLLADLTRTLTG